MSSSNVYDQVKAVFDKYGVPESVWYPIALAESGMNPNAVGDNGASIGLFQINRVGGQGIGYTAEQLRDPVFNAEIAARAIAPAYANVKDTTQPVDLASEVARRSGHPGGSIANPFNADDARIKSIKNLGTKYVNGYMQNKVITAPAMSDNLSTTAKIADPLGINQLQSALASIAEPFQQLTTVFDQMGAEGFLLGTLGILILGVTLYGVVNAPKASQ